MSYNTTTINLEKELLQLGPWHFLIELEPGVFTIPRDQWKTLWHTNIIVQNYTTRTLFPLIEMLNKNSPSDTTVIDIGCNEGWLSLIFHRMGFKRIVGIDPNEANIKKANFLKEYFNLKNVEFYLADINDFKTNEKFDLSIMLGVINHTHNPVGILRNIHSFTEKYLILDFDSFCEDYVETSTEAKFNTDVSSVVGNMRCHFEHAHQTTSDKEGNLVFQYSRRAIQLMMGYAGFDNILHVPPRIFAPSHYKNDKRVMLVGRKNPDKDFCSYELAIDQEYMESKGYYMDFPQPRLLEEGYRKYNIVSYGGKYYGIPQGEMEEFDIINVINNKGCIFGDAIHRIKERIDKSLNTNSVRISEDSDFERDKLRCEIGCELILQSKIEEAKKIFEDLKKRHNTPVTELTIEVLCQLGRIARRTGDIAGAKEYWTRCLLIDPNFMRAKVRLWELEHETALFVCHKMFC